MVAGTITLMSAREQDRGFAQDELVLIERRATARSLVGQHIVRVAYVDIDYRGWDLGYRDQSSRRMITAAAEWSEPTWDAGTFHHLDFGIELRTDQDETWAITWDSPNPVGGESIRLQRTPVSEGGAVWDVTDWEPWRSCITSPVSDVALRYHRWSDHSEGFWCTRVSLSFNDARVEILLGDRDQAAALTPSANNLAVLLDAASLPEWERTDDLV
jgi:hypothetical protein